MMRNITIAFSQPDSEKPNIRLTLFDVSAITAIMGLLVGFVILLVAVIWDICRSKRC